MNLTIEQIIIWGLGIALALILLRFLWVWLRLGILFAAFGAAMLLIADQLYGGTAMQQIANKIADWIRRTFNL